MRTFEQLEYAKLMPWVTSVQQSDQMKEYVMHKGRIEWVLTPYIPLMWSKMGMVSEVSAADPHAPRRYLAWVDAGALEVLG